MVLTYLFILLQSAICVRYDVLLEAVLCCTVLCCVAMCHTACRGACLCYDGMHTDDGLWLLTRACS